MARKATSYLDMAFLWDLNGFISISESKELISSLKDIQNYDSEGNLEALLSVIEDNEAEEIVRTYAVRTKTIQAKADDITVTQLKGIVSSNENGLNLRTAASHALRYIDLKVAVYTLIEILIQTKEPELQTLIAYDIHNHTTLKWQEKTEKLLQTLEKTSIYREHLPIEIILQAILPMEKALEKDRFILTDHLIQKAVGKSSDDRMIGILAGLIIESVGRNLNRANQRVHLYRQKEPDEGTGLSSLLSEMNSRLTPAELEERLRQTFHEPLNKANIQIQEMWEKAIRGNQEALDNRVKAGRNLLYGGIILLMLTIGYYVFGTNEVTDLLLGVLVSLLLLIIAIIYSGRRNYVQQVLADIGIANVVYAAYFQRTLEISNSFARLYLQDKLDTTEIERSNKLISEAMNDAVNALRNSGPNSFDEFIDQFTSP